jgi:hypothetical protein
MNATGLFKTLRRAALPLALALSMCWGAAARASDRVTLKDGRVIEGTIVREESGYVWLKVQIGGIAEEKTFSPTEITKIDRDSPIDAKPKGDAGKPDAAKPDTSLSAPSTTPAEGKLAETTPRLGKAPRAAVITLGEGMGKDMVGLYMTAESLRRAIPLLKEENIEIVVFRVNSGGGYGLEVPKLSDVIEKEYKTQFTVVAWIESAISAAAMTSHTIENIYFLPNGAYGACTGWYGNGTAVKGRQLEEMLYQMEGISARGKHPKEIMRSMQIMDPLSCTIDENGEVHWYQSLEGETIVNPEQRILTFNAQDAMKCKFAKGVAKDIDELGKAMGYNEVVWVGEKIESVPYPVCKAEKLQRDFRAQTSQDERHLREYSDIYVRALDAAKSAPKADRGKYLARARDNLEKIKKMVKNNPNMGELVMNIPADKWSEWVEQQEETIRKIAAA